MIWLDELQRLSSRLAQRHDQRVLRLASMYQIFFTLSQHYGPGPHHENIIALSQCIHARLDEIGTTPTAFEHALIDLSHMQLTMRELARLPEDVDDSSAVSGWQAVDRYLKR